MMLTLESLKYHCRTCLIKLEDSHGNNDSENVLIAKFPNIENLMRICLEDTDGVQYKLDTHIPNICCLCLEKWKKFTKHYRLAIKSDQKLRMFLDTNLGNTDKPKSKFNQIFLAAETANNSCEIEKYETTSPFYQDSLSITSTSYDGQLGGDGLNHCILDESSQKDNSSEGDNSISEYFKFDGDPEPEKSIKTLNKSKTRRKQKATTACKIKRKYKTKKSLTDDQAYVNDSGESLNKKVRYQCEPCKKYFYERQKFEGHVKQIHEGIQRPYQCQDCDKAYNSYKNLAQHITENHSKKSQETHKCEECNKIFKTSVTLRQHIINHHSNSNADFHDEKEDSSNTSATKNNSKGALTRSICDQCGFMAAHQYSLVQHIKNKHTEVKEVKCESCPKIFKSQYSLKYHMLSTHNPTNTKPFQCVECEMTFTRRTLLNLHKRTHLKYTERIKCDFEGCDVRFVKHGDKRHHMRLVHLKVKQHICDFCGEAFGAMQTLRHHRYIHTGEKPYKCNVCGQGFRQRTAMKTHCKTHYGKEETVRPPGIINSLSERNNGSIN